MSIRRIHALWWLTPAAIALRLVLFLGRGDYVAFDEGWYLLLGRNLMAGEGYTLSGLRHVALSPLFPFAAGALDLLVGDAVWSGRIVAAIAAGLLVIPCWFIFRRLAGRRTALLATLIVAGMPALAPFVVPYWIGWDLWVGAEPLFLLLLYTGIACCTAARKLQPAHGVVAGFSLALAYLARPEAVIAAGALTATLFVVSVVRRSFRTAAAAAMLAVAFAATAAPYWNYLHDTLGRWTLTGRAVSLAALPVDGARATARSPSTRIVDQMLWSGDRDYERVLYSLHPDGTRLANSYWGVPAPVPATAPVLRRDAPPPAEWSPPELPAEGNVAPRETRGSAGTQGARASSAALELHFRAIARVVPPLLIPLLIVGLVLRRRRPLATELVFGVPILVTSTLVTVAVAADPRTQLLLAPWAAFYIARSTRAAGVFMQRRIRVQSSIRRGFIGGLLAFVLLSSLLGTSARRLYMSVAVGSPHHLVGAENRRIGEALRDALPPDEPVMSWHPAIALFAGRDWRVLPRAEFEAVVRYANAIGSTNIVLSAYYPSPLAMDAVPGHHLVLHVPPAPAGTRAWRLRVTEGLAGYVTATVEPATP